MKKDRGFSLIELVVVLAVFAVLLGVIIPSINMLPGMRCREAEGKLCAALEQNHTNGMNYFASAMRLYQDGETGDYYVEYYVNSKMDQKNYQMVCQDKIKIGSRKVTISYSVDHQAEKTEIKEFDELWLAYDRDSGSFHKIFSGCPKIVEKSHSEAPNPAPEIYYNGVKDSYYTEIYVSSGKRNRVIHLYPDSGQYQVENVS